MSVAVSTPHWRSSRPAPPRRHRPGQPHPPSVGRRRALATAASLGFLTEPMVSIQRPRLGNTIYGQYGRDFTSSDGQSFMVVRLTARHLGTGRLTRTASRRRAGRLLGVDFARRRQPLRATAGRSTTCSPNGSDPHRRGGRRRAVGQLGAVGPLSRARRGGSSPRVTANPFVCAPASGPDRDARHPDYRCRWTVRTPTATGAAPRRRQPRYRPNKQDMTNGVLTGLLTLAPVVTTPSAERATGRWKTRHGGHRRPGDASPRVTVDAERVPTALHVQFLRGGDAGEPVDYRVTRS